MGYFSVLWSLLKTNLFATVWFNFRVLPFRQAIHFPFFIYGRFLLRSFDGSVIIDCDRLWPGMIKIGKRDWYVATSIARTIWTINGNLVFYGSARFMHGSYLLVARGGRLEMGTRALFGTDVHFCCFDQITLGNDVRMAWDVQIMDTSFHYIEKVDSGEVSSLTKPIIIGNNVWVGNRVTISKGAVLPDYTIVASNSLCNKDYSESGGSILIAGCPARIKMTGVRRIFDKTIEKQYDKVYSYDRTHL